MTKHKAIIFDIDGTLAIRDKSSDGRGPFDWDRVGEDITNEPVMFIAKMIGFAVNVLGPLSDPPVDILMFSGRDEEARYPTELWLDEHFGYAYQLYMREAGDNRPDYIVKKEILERAQRLWEIVAVFDDRNPVVDMWRANGITCLQVCSREEGDF